MEGSGMAPEMPSGMAEDVLWKAAGKLRGSVDAAQYKDFVLGLVFLKCVSDSPGALRVPDEARWAEVSGPGAGPDTGVGARIDAAMDALMRANPSLAGALPKIFGGADQRRLGELVALLGGTRFGGRPARDVFGEVYEYFLEKFARAEGRRGGEFYTPAGVVRLLVEILEPFRGRVYDPCCGSGGMFVQAERFVLSRRGRPADIAVYGQEANERTWRLAKMNLAVHGLAGDLRRADTFHADAHPGLRADHVLANPPFNMSDWYRDPADPRWRYGVPPAGNANFAWLQHIVAKLGPAGRAGVVMANGSLSSRQSGEGGIRAALVEAGLVSCVVALPDRLFRSTPIPACLWFLDKNAGGDARGRVLFIDAREMGTMVDRTERVLTGDDIARIAGAYRSWRDGGHVDVPGFCRSAGPEEIRSHDHVLTPGRYVGTAETDGHGEPAADRVERLTKELFSLFEESERLNRVVRAELGRLNG